MKIKAPKGTQDILPDEIYKWHEVEDIAKSIAESFGYREIRTPVFESTELFARGVGKDTDIVEKEMYTFPDKAGRSMTLRPELTAPVIRSLLEHNMIIEKSLIKLYYIGPIFRYERPQAGRYRQSHQFGVEAIGSDSPLLDAEQIYLAMEFYKKLGLDKLSVDINSIGCSKEKCRANYRRLLTDYLEKYQRELCTDCQRRSRTNPLRVFDCKKEGCAKILRDAPLSADHLCPECKAHYDKVREILEFLNIKYKHNPRMVRGLDYYTRTVYEVLSESLGAQNSLCGGGRYDNLSKELGGPQVPAVGFAAGLERTLIVMEQAGKKLGKPTFPVIILPIGGEESAYKAFEIMEFLRKSGIIANLDYNMTGFKLLKKADAKGWKYAFIIGEDELKKDEVGIKHLGKRSQKNVPLEELKNLLSRTETDPMASL
ncbi:MAG: histidine--tRNA ligase, partial [Candidatus Eremiobacteraeota bacterium]|nr:histidine--tRNA ligase [Candidatus Eremiobacteraeota bacterium]